MNRIKHQLLPISILLSMSQYACALSADSSKQEGENDYAIVENCEISGCSTTDRNRFRKLEPKYKNRDISTEIKGDGTETVSVSLSQGYILHSPERGHAEIAILAYVCEQGTNCSVKTAGADVTEGRVIFYSDSVTAESYLNFSYLPVYGPIKYEGNPLIIQLVGVELDKETDNASQKAILKTLTSFGKQLYAPADAALGILNTIGSTFIDANEDDILFRYTFRLMPDGAVDKLNYPKLHAGNYVFLKKDRIDGFQEQVHWKHLRYDQQTGRLVTDDFASVPLRKSSATDYSRYSNPNKPAGTANFSDKENLCKSMAVRKKTKQESKTEQTEKCDNYWYEYRANTYFTFQIQKGWPESNLNAQQTFAEFQQQLRANNDASLRNTETALSELELQLTQSSKENVVYSELYKAEAVIKELKALETDEISKLGDLKDNLVLSTSGLVDNLKHIHEAHINENCTKDTPCFELKLLQHAFQKARHLLRMLNPGIKNIDSVAPLTFAAIVSFDDWDELRKALGKQK